MKTWTFRGTRLDNGEDVEGRSMLNTTDPATGEAHTYIARLGSDGVVGKRGHNVVEVDCLFYGVDPESVNVVIEDIEEEEKEEEQEEIQCRRANI